MSTRTWTAVIVAVVAAAVAAYLETTRTDSVARILDTDILAEDLAGPDPKLAFAALVDDLIGTMLVEKFGIALDRPAVRRWLETNSPALLNEETMSAQYEVLSAVAEGLERVVAGGEAAEAVYVDVAQRVPGITPASWLDTIRRATDPGVYESLTNIGTLEDWEVQIIDAATPTVRDQMIMAAVCELPELHVADPSSPACPPAYNHWLREHLNTAITVFDPGLEGYQTYVTLFAITPQP